MMVRALVRLWRDRRAAAAAEMAMVTPLLMIVMFGSLELGKYFLDEHVVVKAVRDGARFAARQNFATMPCNGSPTNEAQIKNLVQYGKVAATDADQPRLQYWTNPATITVTVECYDNSGDEDERVYRGIYSERATVPQVTVSASVPYQPLVGSIGFNALGLSVNASNQAPVFGL
jgi:Flp pilus assembly protein TadG